MAEYFWVQLTRADGVKFVTDCFVEVDPLNEIGVKSALLGPKTIQGFPGGPWEIRSCSEMPTWW